MSKNWIMIMAAGLTLAGCVSTEMKTERPYDVDFQITESTSTEEKARFIAGFREYYAVAISADLMNLPQAKAKTFELFSNAVKAGLTIPEVFGMLTDENGILFRREFQSNPATHELIDYIKKIEAAEIYEAAGVSRERDFYLDSDTGRWKPKQRT